MRKLGLKDAFAVARIIKAADIRSEISAFAGKILAKKDKNERINVYDVGLEFVITLITAVCSQEVENLIYKLYADIKGCSVDEAGITDFTTLKADITEIINENDLKSFFHSASALM